MTEAGAVWLRVLRSAGAVISGIVCLLVVVTAGTIAATALFIPGGLRAAMDPAAPPQLTTSYLSANIAVSLLAAILGGWVTARLAPAAPQSHVLVLAVLALGAAIPSATSPALGQPRWYGLVIGIVGVGGILLGGWLRTARTSRAARPADARG
jgi:hypothetical protein